MQTRPLVLTGVTLVSLAGCQSYFPNGYGNAGAYPAMPPPSYPQGGYPPRTQLPPGSPPTTYAPNRTPPPGQVLGDSPALKNNYVPAVKNPNPVPTPRDPGGAPAGLGGPGAPSGLGTPADDTEETIRRGTGSLERQPSRLGDLTDDSDENLRALGDDTFSAPRSIQSTGALEDGDDMPRVARKPRRSPYNRDPAGNYTWLMGTVSRDPKGSVWRLKYSDNPLDEEDKFGGSMIIVGHDEIDSLIDNDVVLVKGQIDPKVKDHYGKPAYRVLDLKLMKPKDE